MTNPPLVEPPAGYVPPLAVAFGGLGEPAVAVNGAHPLPVSDQSFTGAAALQPGVLQEAGRALLVDCAQAGRATLVLANGSQLALPLARGLSILPFAVTEVAVAGLTASASFTSLF